MRKLRIGHIGWLGIDQGDDFETVAWCDIDAEKLEKGSTECPGIALYRDYREMLQRAELDIVVIASPSFIHAEQAVAFLKAGVNVFLEKPMGVNREECNRVIEAWKQSGKRLTVDFEIRVSPFAERVKSLIDSGDYGELRRIEYIHHKGCWLDNGNGNWRTAPEGSGGMLMECPIHYVDIFRFFAGEIESVQSTVGPNVLPHYKVDDNVCSHFFFSSGAMATMLTSHTLSATPVNDDQWSNAAEYMHALGHDMRMVFTLTGGSFAVDFLVPSILINRFEQWPAGSGSMRVIHERTESFRNAAYEFYHDSNVMKQEFIKRCVSSSSPVQDPVDFWRSHMACLAAEQSAREEFRRVKVDYKLPGELQ